MILAIDAQVQLLLGEVSSEIANQQNATHNKDRRTYELLGSAACLIGSAYLMMRHDPDKPARRAAWNLIRAANLVTEEVEVDLPKLRTMKQLDRLFRLDD